MKNKMVEATVHWLDSLDEECKRQLEISDRAKELNKKDNQEGVFMKKSMAILAVMMVMSAASAFAGAFDQCSYNSYTYCTEKYKHMTSTGPNGSSYCTVDTPASIFKACKDDAYARCKKGEVLDLTIHPCQ